jgi:hypothetical protein
MGIGLRSRLDWIVTSVKAVPAYIVVQCSKY